MQELDRSLAIHSVSLGLIYIKKGDVGAILDDSAVVWLSQNVPTVEFRKELNIYQHMEWLLDNGWRVFRFGANEKEDLLLFHILGSPGSRLRALLEDPHDDRALRELIALKDVACSMV
jgi:hypothetical protein